MTTHTKIPQYDYRTSIFSRFPPTKAWDLRFPSTRLGRSLLVIEVPLNNHSVAIGTVHLESYGQDVEQRKQQLVDCQTYLIDSKTAEYDTCFLMGDFNFASDDERKDRLSELKFKDTWQTLRPNESGNSVDPERNIMRKIHVENKGTDLSEST